MKKKSRPMMTAAEFGRRGGYARALALSPERRSEIARNAVMTRWAKARGGVLEYDANHPDTEDD